MEQHYIQELEKIESLIKGRTRAVLGKYNPESDLTSLCNIVDRNLLGLVELVSRKADIAIKIASTTEKPVETDEERGEAKIKQKLRSSRGGLEISQAQAFRTAIMLGMMIKEFSKLSGWSVEEVIERIVPEAKKARERMSDEVASNFLELYAFYGKIPVIEAEIFTVSVKE